MTDLYSPIDIAKLLGGIAPRHKTVPPLSVADFAVLLVISEGSCAVKDVQMTLGWGVAVAVEHIDALVKRMMVQRTYSTVDRRKTLVSLTAKGLRVVNSGRKVPWDVSQNRST
jgi:DNA-binding MarR family transcriptional regulator